MSSDSRRKLSREVQCVKVKLRSGAVIVLYCAEAVGRHAQWHVEGRPYPDEHELDTAQDMLDRYHYSPGHGYPGCYIASQVADRIGGKIVHMYNPPYDTSMNVQY